MTPRSIPLSEGTLVIVCKGLHTIEKGVFAGEKTIGTTRVYLDGVQIGLLNGFTFSANAGEAVPQLTFDFGKFEAEADSEVLATLRPLYAKVIEKVKTFFPWAKWSSPIGNSPSEAVPDVLDPGSLNPSKVINSGGGLHG